MKNSKPQKPAKEKKSGAELSDKPQRDKFLVVGLGASAGGIQAFREFFENVPADSGLAYVVILHLSPDHDSKLAEILQQSTQIPVSQIKERATVVPNHIYVVPPNEHLKMTDGEIEVVPNLAVEERRAPVDIFFRSLAESHHERAVAVILSGTGADGSMGLKRVKERGGACFVQNPREAEFSEMPRNAIATDLVDLILNVSEIPAHILAYKDSLGKIEISIEAESRSEDQQQALREIFTQLRLRTGHDFSNYKRPTVLRRIERRINVRGLDGLPAYAGYVRDNPDETIALLKDLLISVTNFFRDKEAFLYWETDVLPKIFYDKKSEDQVRIWVCGSATGEEAYSLAMLCAERTLGLVDAPEVQIFATDIDEQAIAKAREGFYTLNDAADVSPERLRRFFNKVSNGYRIRRELREMVLFANHNVIKDPPFSHLDAVTCRNMLIYLNRAAQERVMETFHFALEPGGFLMLGNSETTDGASDLYATVSKTHHVYQSRNVSGRTIYPIPDSRERAALFFDNTSATAFSLTPQSEGETHKEETNSLGDLHLRLLEQYTPSVLVNEQYDIVHLSDSAARFLQMKGGEPTQNLLKLICQELRIELRAAIYQAAERQTNVEVKNLKINGGGREELIDIHIRPIAESHPDTAPRGFFLILFEPSREGGGGEISKSSYRSPEPVAAQIEAELMRSQTQLQRTVEKHEVQAEELKASNEELQAMNEELRSAGEELETGKEELQSINEELKTVNQELKVKIEELSQSTNDFHNLINSTEIATIFLDRSFRIQSFTPAASRIFNLIPSDYGRPISDITHRLKTNRLLADAEKVLDTLQTIEREVGASDGRTYLMRVLPYRTQEDSIGGVVATFLDITERKRAEDKLRESEARQAFLLKLADALRPLSDPLEIQRTAMRVLGEHLQADRVLYSEIEPDDRHFVIADNYARGNVPKMIGRFPLSDYDNAQKSQRRGETFVLPDIRSAGESDEHAAFLAAGVQALIGVPLHKDGRWVASLSVHQGSPREWLLEDAALVEETAERTWAAVERARAETALRESEARLRLALDASEMGTFLWYPQEDRTEMDARMRALLGLTEGDRMTLAEALAALIHPDDRELYARAVADSLDPNGEGKLDLDYRILHPDKSVHWLHIYGHTSFINENPPRAALMYGMALDITTRKRTEVNLAFLAEVSKDLARLTDIDETMSSLCAKIGEHFKVARVVFAEIGEDETTSVIRHEWRQAHLPTLKEAAELKKLLTSKLESAKRDGEIAYIKDVAAELRDAELDLTALGIAAILGAPIVRDEKLHLYLGILDSEPREWRADEIELMRQLTARIRTRLESARAEDALRESEGRLRALVENLPGGAVFIVDKKLRYLVAHGEALANAGFKPEDLIGRTVGEAMSPELADSYEPMYRQALLGESFKLEHEAHDRTFISRGVPLTDSSGNVYAVLAISYDITERKRAEKALAESEERLRLLIESASDYAIFTLTPDNLIDSWNTGAKRVFGWTENEALGKSGEMIFTPEDREKGAPEQEIKTVLRTGRAPDERFHIRKDGSRFFASGVMTLLKNDGEGLQGFAKIARDMTESIAAEKALRDKELLQKLVGAQEDERKRIARDLHDELGQQLTALRLKLDAAKKMCNDGELCDEIDEIELIAKSIDNGVDFLAWELRPAALDDLGLVAALNNYIKQWSHYSGVATELLTSNLKSARFAPEVETNLYRIVQEALNNTHKHARAKSAEIVIEKRDNLIVVLIEDDGVGFNPKDKKIKRKGIGLIGMKERAQLVGGEIEIESAPGMGTTVFVRVPAVIQKRRGLNDK